MVIYSQVLFVNERNGEVVLKYPSNDIPIPRIGEDVKINGALYKTDKVSHNIELGSVNTYCTVVTILKKEELFTNDTQEKLLNNGFQRIY